jgi:uncharacterized repeat protein (TIGR04076 family)
MSNPGLTLEDYVAFVQSHGPIEIRMIEKHGPCFHELGDTFRYQHPYRPPTGKLCPALIDTLAPFIWRVALGMPSWEDDDPKVWRIHCPWRTGTVWEVRMVETEAEQDRG